MKLKSPWLVKPEKRVRLKDYDSSDDGGMDKTAADEALKDSLKKLEKLQEVLYASQTHSVLLVLQGMDTAGKDGAVKHIFSGVNPQGCNVASFKVPTLLEARHDFLWRCHAAAPALGMMTVFNRSHYEQVLSPRVHKLVSAKKVKEDLGAINDWEKMLVENGTVVLKFFLHISKEEQKRRLQARLDDADKLWKFSEGDLHERMFWDGYQEAYEDILSETSKKHAPWFVIPSDLKWYRSATIAGILVDALKGLKLEYPKATVDPKTIKL